ncbi:MAG TPA: glycosyltransferase family 39 protein, partial [Thermoanaerobaculia bacterium]|nr:glycosyltransferase family 39 protein [Thermoanaerobaculia bacterium]
MPAVVFVLALLARLAYFAADPNWNAPDSHKYLHPAESLVAGEGFSHDGEPETLRTPGYPLLLAVLNALHLTPRQIVFLQHLASALLAAALTFAAKRATGSSLIGAVAGLYAAIDLPTIFHANQILTETFFTILCALFVWILWRFGEAANISAASAAATGLLLGFLILVRPLTILFIIPAALYLLWIRQRGRVRVVLAFTIAALLLPIGWIARNSRVAGIATISTNGAVLLADFHAPGALAMEDPEGPANFERRQREVRALADARVRAALGPVDLGTLPYAKRAAIDAQLGREILRAHPIGFAKLFAWGVAANLLGGSAEAVVRIAPLSRSEANALLLPYNILALVLAVAGQLWLLAR